MKALQIFSLLFLFGLFQTQVFADDASTSENNEFKKHRISVLWGNTYLPAAKTATDEQSVLVFPSWGLNYEFWFNKHIAIGWHNEIEMQSYVIEHEGHPDIEREYPFITSVVAIYEPFNRLALFIGPGIEIEANHSFYICKMGVEYVIPLPKSFDVAFGGSYEIKNKLYDAWTFGITFGKRFGKTSAH